MRGLLTILTLAALVAAPSAEARETFFGYGQIVGRNAAKCTDWDPLGDRFVVRYRPPIAGTDNGPDAHIGLFYQNGARGLNVPGGVNVGANSAFKFAPSVNVFDGWGIVNQPVQLIRYLVQAPANLTPTTQFITIIGQIRNWDWQLGCTVTFRFSLQKRQSDIP
jgi:hypothetical protein